MDQTTKLFDQVAQKINAAKKIAVFAHVSYDPDGLGSLYGLAEFLKTLKKKVDKFVDTTINQIDAKLFDPQELSDEMGEYDLLIMVDTPNIERLGKFGSAFKAHQNTVRLDHHVGIFHDAKLEITLPSFTSASEVVLELIEHMGKKPNKLAATYLYAGLATDTDNFLIDSVDAKTFEHAVKLAQHGADISRVNVTMFKTKSKSQFNLQKIMHKNLRFYDDIAISCLTAGDFKKAKASKNDCANFANSLIYFDGVNISCLIKQEDKNLFSCSLRSKKGYNVRKIANIFGGGGHIQASACKIPGSLKSVRSQILSAIKENK